MSFAAMAACLMGLLSGAGYAADDQEDMVCSEGWVAIKAQIVRIVPTNAVLTKRLPDGRELPLRAGSLICANDSVHLPAKGPVRYVLIYQGGRVRSVSAGQPFPSPQGVSAVTKQTLAFFSDFFGAVGGIGTVPELSVDTTSRGENERDAELRKSVFLGDSLPAQRITPGSAPLAMWRDGEAPYTCLLRSNDGRALWKTRIEGGHGSCEFSHPLTGTHELVVEDARGASVSWAFNPAQWAEVPRPPWIPVSDSPRSSADRTAWALWLWREAGPEWRLQALAMLNEGAPHEFLAAYARDKILAQSPAYAPR